MPKLTRQQCRDVAMCCRIAAVQAKQDAEKQASLEVRIIHERSAAYREQLAEMFERASKER